MSGAAKDVSMLIDYLPSYLFPNDEHEIVDWGVAGISLGGESSWLCLAHGYPCHRQWLITDDRIKWGCDFIGCPSLITHMENRLKESGLPASPPWLPRSLLRVLERDDPGAILRRTGRVPPSLKTKRILVLHGTEDPMVPWSISSELISHLQQQCEGLQIKLYDNWNGGTFLWMARSFHGCSGLNFGHSYLCRSCTI